MSLYHFHRPAPPPDPEIHTRTEAKQVRCPRCAAPAGTDCDLTAAPPLTKRAPSTYHAIRLLRAREGW